MVCHILSNIVSPVYLNEITVLIHYLGANLLLPNYGINDYRMLYLI